MAKTPTINIREASDAHGGLLPRLGNPGTFPRVRSDGTGIEYATPEAIGGAPLSDDVPPDVDPDEGLAGIDDVAARGDHTHKHGNLEGGSRHSVATTNAHGFHSATDKVAHDRMYANRMHAPPSAGTDAEGADSALWQQLVADAIALNASHPGGVEIVLGPYKYELLPADFDISGCVMLHFAGCGGDVFRGTRLVFRRDFPAIGSGSGGIVGNSTSNCKFSRMSVQNLNHNATGDCIVWDGTVLGSDGATNVLDNVQFYQPQPYLTTALPAFVRSHGGDPLPTLLRSGGTTDYCHYDCVVEITNVVGNTVTYSVSRTGGAFSGAAYYTRGNSAGPAGDGMYMLTGQTFNQTAGTTKALTGTSMRGLSIVFPIGTYTIGHTFRARAGVRWMQAYATYAGRLDLVQFVGGYEGAYLSGTGWQVVLQTCSGLGRHAIHMSSQDGEMKALSSQPGGGSDGGYGGFWAANCIGVVATQNTGDPNTKWWIRISGGSGNRTAGSMATTAAEAVLVDAGATSTWLGGDFSLAANIVRTSNTLGTCAGLFIDAAFPGAIGAAWLGDQVDPWHVRTDAVDWTKVLQSNLSKSGVHQANGSTALPIDTFNLVSRHVSAVRTWGAGTQGGDIGTVATGQHPDVPVGSTCVFPNESDAGAGFAPMMRDASATNGLAPSHYHGPDGHRLYGPGNVKTGLWTIPSNGVWNLAGDLLRNVANPATDKDVAVVRNVTATTGVSGSITLDYSTTYWKRVSATGNVTVTAITNPGAFCASLVLDFRQDGTGGRTLTLPASVVNGAAIVAGIITTASTRTLIGFASDGSDFVATLIATGI